MVFYRYVKERLFEFIIQGLKLQIFESAPTDQKCLLKDKGTNFCLKMANYPRKQIEKLVKKMSAEMKNAFFSKDFRFNETCTRSHVKLRDIPEETLCHSQVEIFHPESLITKEGLNKVIVNLNEFKQAIRVQKCM